MRPSILFPLFGDISELPGVGPRIQKLIAKVAGDRVVDLLWHLPTGLIDRRFAPKVADAPAGRIATLTVRVDRHIAAESKRRPYRVRCSDDTGTIDLVFFHPRLDYLAEALPPGQTRIVSGKIELFGGKPQMAHPDHIGKPEERDQLKAVEPVYRLTAGLSPKTLAKAIRAALEKGPELAEWIDPSQVAGRKWPTWLQAVQRVHAPQDDRDLQPDHPDRQRLAYDELLATQLALFVVRNRQRQRPGRSINGDYRLRRKVFDALPFELTPSQVGALKEIGDDMKASTRMLRLLQGDVGSGKTVVALFAMLNAVESGHQAVLMAPTEILARQHFATIERLAAAAGVTCALLTGRDTGKARARVLSGLADGTVALAIGTHALFQQGVTFKDLALAVIDEQHRFGVHQRLDLAAKGQALDMLIMTATPIPRTLMLAAYGDMAESRLTEKPAGRKPVATRVMPASRLQDVVAACQRAIRGGAKVFWVCPLVEESEAVDLAAATDRHAHLQTLLGSRVGLVHGRMKGAEKDKAMAAFAGDEVDLLVATTVIEVGVDVPAATVMVIEHAERFGLAQLHQLRGRIGRGDAESTCLLLYSPPLGEAAKARLAILRDTDDGFRIAEEDLQLRGAGEVLGTRQSGLPDFRLADLAHHADLLPVARDDARLALERDPELESDRGEALRTLLYLFDRDAAIRYLRSG